MARFYGWTHSEIENLSLDDFDDYWLGLLCVEAQENLLQITIASYPYMKKEDQRERHKELYLKAYKSLERDESAAKVKTADFAKVFALKK